jgi:ABC-type Na+ transport system ATPase subunit NatA
MLGDSGSAASALMAVMAGRASTSASRVLVGTRKLPVHTSGAARYVGYVPPEPACPDSVTPRSHLALVAACRRLGGREAERTVSDLLEWCLLAEKAGLPWRELQEDDRSALAIASALLDNPQVLLIDGGIPSFLLERLSDLKGLGRALVIRSRGVEGIPPAVDRVAVCDGDGLAAVVRRADLEGPCRRMSTIRVGFYPSLPRDVMEQLPGAAGLRSEDGCYVFSHRETSSALVHLSGIARANARAIVSLRVLPPETGFLARQLAPDPDSEQTLFDRKDRP